MGEKIYSINNKNSEWTIEMHKYWTVFWWHNTREVIFLFESGAGGLGSDVVVAEFEGISGIDGKSLWKPQKIEFPPSEWYNKNHVGLEQHHFRTHPSDVYV
jgi:hypothetical protein